MMDCNYFLVSSNIQPNLVIMLELIGTEELNPTTNALAY